MVSEMKRRHRGEMVVACTAHHQSGRNPRSRVCFEV